MGLGLAAAYLAGANSTSGLMHVWARQMASAEAQGFSNVALQRAGGLAPGALAIAQRHDPFTISGAAQRDRQSADFAARLDSAQGASIGALDGARDLDCLTQAVYYEARGENPKGQAAVAQVVLNRVRHPAFPKTICAVVFQGAGKRKTDCQFSFVCDGSMRGARDNQAWDRAQHIAARALSGVVLADIGGATHFHASRLETQWGDGLIKVAQVGLHVFYKFGHAHPAFQAQLFQASADTTPARPPAEIKPVLASLLPPGPAPLESAKAETKPEAAAKEAPIASVEAPKPVAEKKTEAPTA
jgi:hypothetical protein